MKAGESGAVRRFEKRGAKMRGKILRLWLVLPILCIIMLSLPLSQSEAAFRARSGGAAGSSSGSPSQGGGGSMHFGSAAIMAPTSAAVGAPTVTKVSPSTGSSGTSVTITGTNFTGVQYVYFGNMPVGSGNFTVNSTHTQITVTVPAISYPNTSDDFNDSGYLAPEPSTLDITVKASSSYPLSPTTSADRFTYTSFGSIQYMWNAYADQSASPTTGLQYPTGTAWSGDYVQIGGVPGKNSTYSGGNPVTGAKNSIFTFTGANHLVDLFGWIDNVQYDQSDVSFTSSTFNVVIYDNSGNKVYTFAGLSADDEDKISSPNNNPYYWILGTNGKDPEPNEKYYTYPKIQFNLSTIKNPTAGTWTWHACVFKNESGVTPPGTYPGDLDNTDPYFFANGTTRNTNLDYVAECGFKVATSIPEFPSAAAPVAVVGLCAGIYCWLRKRQLATPAA